MVTDTLSCPPPSAGVLVVAAVGPLPPLPFTAAELVAAQASCVEVAALRLSQSLEVRQRLYSTL